MNPVRPRPVKKSLICNGTRWFYTYVLRCDKTGTFYTGATDNLERRLKQHNEGKVYYTKNKLPIKLVYSVRKPRVSTRGKISRVHTGFKAPCELSNGVYFEACLNKDDAYRRERYLKTGMGKRYLKNRIVTVRNLISNGMKEV